jgi:hypothetical protein
MIELIGVRTSRLSLLSRDLCANEACFSSSSAACSFLCSLYSFST